MTRHRWLALVVTALLVFAAVGSTAPARARTNEPLVNTMPTQMLVTANGMSLYVFAHDTKNQSNCTGGCAKFWPPLLVPPGSDAPTSLAGFAGTFGVATRADGSRQLTYDGAPLYTFSEDAARGQMNGQGLFGLWWVVVAPPAASQAAAGVDASSLVGTAPADMLVTPQGLPLYVFTPDKPNQIACTGICARFWPALRAAPGTSPLAPLLRISGIFGITLRPDGGQQLTYDGAPLYTFIRDAQPGDMKGQGVLSTWWIAVAP